MSIVRYPQARSVAEFVGMPGNEIGGQLLSPAALADLAESRTSGLPCQTVVIGEEHTATGRWLLYGTPRDYIEATTDYREIEGRMTYVCPDCGGRSGKHTKACGLA